MIERNATVHRATNKVTAEVELDHDPGFTLRIETVSDIAGRRQINDDCNVYGAMVTIAEAIEYAGQKSYDGDRLRFEVTFTKGRRADSSM